MPYIAQDRRAVLFAAEDTPKTAGELNYRVTMLMLEAVRAFPKPHYDEVCDAIGRDCGRYLEEHGLCYQNINDVIGALTCAGMEFRRRVPRSHWPATFFNALAHGFYDRIAAPYEDQKISDNGDISYGH